MKLTNYEQEMLDGKFGRLKQVAMENVVSYAKILGAEELCEVTKATVFCGSHNYLEACESDDFDTVFSEMNLCRSEKIKLDSVYENCYVQSCVGPCDMSEYKLFNQSEKLFKKNKYFLEEYNKAGVSIVGTCSPYLTGWIPVMGEHFVTTESSMTAIGNSVWGACCNADGIEAAFWSAISGRTPKWGYHVKENRKGTHLVNVNVKLETITDWELFGDAIGKQLPANCNPVLVGDFKNMNFNKLRYFFTALSISSNCRMCHIVGVTPEARTIEDAFAGNECQGVFEITEDNLKASYDVFCEKGENDHIDLVSLGCPHYDIDQIKKVAQYLKGKKINKNVLLMVWTVYPIKHMADVNGYTKIIEDAGGKIFTGTCPTTIGEVFLGKYKAQVYDSIKQTGSVKSEIEWPLYYSDMYSCLDAALTGQWKESNRWKR